MAFDSCTASDGCHRVSAHTGALLVYISSAPDSHFVAFTIYIYNILYMVQVQVVAAIVRIWEATTQAMLSL